MNTGKNFFEILDEVDKLLAGPPDVHAVERVAEYAKDKKISTYIFVDLMRADWLLPLKQKNLFVCNVPSDQPWAQMEYLTRVSKELPHDVFEVIRPLLSTDNIYLQLGIARAVLNFDADDTKIVISSIRQWILNGRTGGTFLFFDESVQLIRRLVDEDRSSDASELLRALLSLKVKETFYKVGEGSHSSRDVVSAIDSWHYSNMLDEVSGVFFSRFPLIAFEIVADLLAEAVQLRTNGSPPEDHSVYWCEDLAEFNPENSYGVENVLVGHLREISLKYIGADESRLKQVLDIFDKKSWHIFRRFQFFILSQLPAVSIATTKAYLSQTEMIDSHDIKNEYLTLLGSAQAYIEQDVLEKILSRVSLGPGDLPSNLDSLGEKERSELAIYSTNWKREVLSPLKDILPKAWRDILDNFSEVISQHETEFPSPPKGVWIGPRSSRTFEELSGCSNAELVQILKAEPDKAKTLWSNSPEGLASVLTSVIKSDPNRSVGLFSDFLVMRPSFINSLLSGVQQSSSLFEQKNWPALLDFMDSIKNRISNDGVATQDSWQSTRLALGWLLERSLQDRVEVLFTELDIKVWALIEWLVQASSEPLDEARKLESTMGPYGRAINSARGVAFQCVIQFGLRRFSIEKTKQTGGMDPRVKGILTKYIDPNVESSLAVRSVYGRFLPWLVLMDKAWVSSNLNNLFPSGEKFKPDCDSVWITYLTYCPVYDNVFEVTESQYRKSVDSLGIEWLIDNEQTKPKKKLAEHLMALYWRGKIALDSPLIVSFYEKADTDLKRSALAFIGSALQNTKDKPPEVVVDRLTRLLESRFQESTKTNNFEELGPFNSWLGIDFFPASWRLEKMTRISEKLEKGEPAFDLIETLNGMREINPMMVMRCLENSIFREKSALRYSSGKNLKNLLQFYLHYKADASVQEQARSLINKIGSLGHFDFREILKAPAHQVLN